MIIYHYENHDNPFEERRIKISEWETYASSKIELNDEIMDKARTYMKNGLRQKDAAHIACAVSGQGDFFITVDKKILNKSINGIIIIDPVSFLRRLQNDN